MYRNDSRVVITLDAGGTNFVFSAMCGYDFIIDPITYPSNSQNLDTCLQTMLRGFREVMVKAFRLIGFCLCLLDSANSFRVRDTPFGSGVCGCANLIKSSTKIVVKVGSGDNYACLSLFSGKMSLFDTPVMPQCI